MESSDKIFIRTDESRKRVHSTHTHTHAFDSLFSSRHASESFIIISTTVAAATTASATAVVAT